MRLAQEQHEGVVGAWKEAQGGSGNHNVTLVKTIPSARIILSNSSDEMDCCHFSNDNDEDDHPPPYTKILIVPSTSQKVMVEKD